MKVSTQFWQSFWPVKVWLVRPDFLKARQLKKLSVFRKKYIILLLKLRKLLATHICRMHWRLGGGRRVIKSTFSQLAPGFLRLPTPPASALASAGGDSHAMDGNRKRRHLQLGPPVARSNR
ncbi:hypothetical protein BaRGS_00004794 [Batillaria attramentaria]|uniref:Uncharacterized protein n=1 Tax=Batillaria attramentaria TaxID=370345 RepID=A0ABD0LX29_9CAEN